MQQSVYTHGDVRLPFDYTHGPKIIKHATLLFVSFSYAPKRPSPFFLYIPQKKPSFNYKVWTYYRILVSKRVKSQKTGPLTNPATTPPQKFLLLLRYNLFISVDEMRVKNITVSVSVKVSATVRVSLVSFVVLVASGVTICRPAVCIAKCSQLSHGRPYDSWLHLAIHTASHVYSIVHHVNCGVLWKLLTCYLFLHIYYKQCL